LSVFEYNIYSEAEQVNVRVKIVFVFNMMVHSMHLCGYLRSVLQNTASQDISLVQWYSNLLILQICQPNPKSRKTLRTLDNEEREKFNHTQVLVFRIIIESHPLLPARADVYPFLAGETFAFSGL
jgi:hypothetical protein